MNWDAVEREFQIISAGYVRLANSFRALAHELRRERLHANHEGYTEGARPTIAKNKKGPEGQSDLFVKAEEDGSPF